MSNGSGVMVHLARALIASLFVLGGLNKVVNYEDVLAVMAQADLPTPDFLLPIVIALELIGGSIVALGRRHHGLAALLLAAFTAATNLLLHDFWSLEGASRQVELSLFFKNVVVIGALLHVAALDAGSARSTDVRVPS